MSLTTKIETPSVTYEQPTGLYIDGKWVKGKEGKTFETINPSNEKPIVAVHEAGPDGIKSSSADHAKLLVTNDTARC
jgi:aldehyde dehydrogenase (NAD+)